MVVNIIFYKLIQNFIFFTYSTFYEANSSNYKIPLIVLEKGLNVACVYGGKWHRGIIKTVPPEGNPIVSSVNFIIL